MIPVSVECRPLEQREMDAGVTLIDLETLITLLPF